MDIDIDYQRSSYRLTTDLAHPSNADIARSDAGADADAEASCRIDTGNGTEKGPENEVFYVQSASSQTKTTHSNRHHHHRRHVNNPSIAYEVRLAGWNCTCPAFAFSAFGRILDLNSGVAHVDSEGQHPLPADDGSLGCMNKPEAEIDLKWRFGGTLTQQTASEPGQVVETPAPVPVCKHILAALLGKHIPVLFGSGVHFRTVSREEGAAWAAGWGDGD